MLKNRIVVLLSASMIFAVAILTSFGILTLLNADFELLSIVVPIGVTIVIGLTISLQRVGHSKKIKEDLERQTNVFMQVINMTQKMANIHNSEELYNMILQTAVSVMPNATMGSIMVLDEDNYMMFKACEGFDLKELQSVHLKLDETYLYHLTNGKLDRTVIANNAKAENKAISGKGNDKIAETSGTDLINSTISAPLFLDGSVYGMMNVDSMSFDAFGKYETELMNFFASEVVKVIKLYDSIEENNRLSKYDPLTNIYNRRYLLQKLDQYIIKNEPFVLVSMDINNLKEVNDQYGHDNGDDLILTFVAGIKPFLQDDDIFCRYGGDEFIVLMSGKSKEEVKGIFELASKGFEQKSVNDKMKDVKVSYSYGVTAYPEDGRDYEMIMLKADQLMYEQKRSYHMGRGK